uniref:Uncharacterized protein n=1 Tax=viral metagenome TaxID=1070528 RepID=A0A6C0AP76_9ZZZZ
MSYPIFNYYLNYQDASSVTSSLGFSNQTEVAGYYTYPDYSPIDKWIDFNEFVNGTIRVWNSGENVNMGSQTYNLIPYATITYYKTLSDATNKTNKLSGIDNDIVVGSRTIPDKGPCTSWIVLNGGNNPPYNPVANPPSGSPFYGTTVNSGDSLTIGFNYSLYPASGTPSAPCFLKGSKILCASNNEDIFTPIEKITRGTLVKTSENSYRRVKLIGFSTISNPGNAERLENRLYVCRKEAYPELEEDLYLTGNHSILVPRITDEEKEKTLEILKDIFVTAEKYRLIACIDKRAEPWVSEGLYTVWHLALESNNEVVNFGVYANGGLLVETACIQTLRDKSGMTMV